MFDCYTIFGYKLKMSYLKFKEYCEYNEDTGIIKWSKSPRIGVLAGSIVGSPQTRAT